MRYQQTGASAFHDEIPGYVAGHSISVYYAEPWSGVESEKEARVRPMSRGAPGHHYGHDLKGHSKGTPSHYRQVAHELRGLKGAPTHFGEMSHEGKGGRGTPTHYGQLPQRALEGGKGTPTHYGQLPQRALEGGRCTPTHYGQLPQRALESGRGTPTHYGQLPQRQHQQAMDELKGLRSSPAHSVGQIPHESCKPPAPVTSSAPPADDNA
ncbi:uncharacterized protein [Littorina saxatilis]|uniref:uncharacterized protein n=1 Tax=Littorina saxatilis TaxID=31220 RepID=UPI0038B5D372